MRLLIVEDSQELASAMTDAFAKVKVSCDVAGTAADADQLIATFHYAAIILDLGLPDEDGLELLQRLRANGRVEPVLILTARSAPAMRVQGLRLGADDYLIKPFYFQELHARMDALWRRRGGYIERQVHLGDLSYDLQTKETHIGPVPVELSTRESELLEILMRRRNHVTPRTVLEDQLFGSGEELSSNAVDVYVHRLRKKIEARSESVRVQTVRGVGYLLTASAP